MKKSSIGYFYQIDIVKALAIISVIISHALSQKTLMHSQFQFHINLAVIIFFILMGLTLSLSFKDAKTPQVLRSLYNLKYFSKKVQRLVIPFLIVFLLSIIGGILFKKHLYFGWLTIIGYLPASGPGNYFFSIVLEFILIAPLIYYFFKKSPIMTLILAYGLNLLFELIAPHIHIFSVTPYLYSASIFRYLFAIVLGLFVFEEYLTKKKINLISYQNYGVLLLLPLSIYYLYLGRYAWQPFSFFKYDWGTHNILAVPFAFVLTVLLLNINYLKTFKQKSIDVFSEIGRASYHIFLVQILIFGSQIFARSGLSIIEQLILNLSASILLGLGFYYLENYFYRHYRNR